MKDHNTETLALQKRIGELNAVIIMRDDQMRELQHQLAGVKHALEVVLPMAKGYAVEHQVGRNNQIVLWAECIAKGEPA